ncbi:MAG TPA: mechanosensitive ion channel domain-containing protein [Symbiobacteriaceae bacterium]|nr:mechanosensitive ion channel domain-containing protein [Symbiobacteriaceae bacterium]
MLQYWIDLAYAVWLSRWMDWAVFGLYLIITWVAAALARRLMRSIMPLFTARTNTLLDDKLVKAAAGPVRLTVLALGLRMSLQALANRIVAFQAGGAYAVEFGWAVKIAIALVILAVTALANAMLKAILDWYIHGLATRSQSTWDEELLPLFRRILSLLLYFIAASIIFEEFGYPITALVTTAGVASLAVALAAQETLSNMLGGFVILVDRPFRIGDVIELADGKVGEVVEIGLRSTRIKQFDGNALVVPNKDMANSRVINYALPDPSAAIRQTISVSYGTDVDRAKAVLLDVMSAHPEVLKDPAPGVWFTRFGESGLDLFMSAWVASYKERFRIADELNSKILTALREAGIEIPFPKRDVRLTFETEAGEEIRREMGKHTNQA